MNQNYFDDVTKLSSQVLGQVSVIMEVLLGKDCPVLAQLLRIDRAKKAVQDRDLPLDALFSNLQPGKRKTHPSCNVVYDTGEGNPGQGAIVLAKEGLLYLKDPETQELLGPLPLLIVKHVRPFVLRLTHDIPLAGHLGVEKPLSRVLHRLYWPGVRMQVQRYCQARP